MNQQICYSGQNKILSISSRVKILILGGSGKEGLWVKYQNSSDVCI